MFLHRDPTSHRRHVLWVADRDPLAVPVGRTPLLAGRVTDIWQPAPIGLDERGQLVAVPLLWNSVLVGALPRQGKTFAARLMALYAALDPYVKLDVFDGKGSPTGAGSPWSPTPARSASPRPGTGLPPEILLATLRRIKDDVQDRYNRLSELPADVCPEGKLTREIARDPEFRMPVRLLVLDEFQEYYDLGTISAEIAELLAFLVKVAPGAGVSLIGSTQRPSGIGTGQVGQRFTGTRDNFAVRFCLRTSDYRVSEMVLGAGAYGEGLDSSTLLPQYKGVGILRGATDASPTVRTYLADGQDAETHPDRRPGAPPGRRHAVRDGARRGRTGRPRRPGRRAGRVRRGRRAALAGARRPARGADRRPVGRRHAGQRVRSGARARRAERGRQDVRHGPQGLPPRRRRDGGPAMRRATG